ncbi:MAG: hypothetical protein JWO62_3640 [Acidimicrobiaceae bacterium]|jgi:hypothetical protein|nr:hypothetical protein [Acidimicrobiaceae bacterium]
MGGRADRFDLSSVAIPDRLPLLDRGSHDEREGRACAMEAASWLSCEPWSDAPRSVHPVLARAARAANDQLDDDERQKIWPLILASLGTTRRARPLLRVRLERSRRRACRELGRNDLRAVWEAVLDEHARLCGHRGVDVPRDRFVSLADRLRR